MWKSGVLSQTVLSTNGNYIMPQIIAMFLYLTRSSTPTGFNMGKFQR